MSAGGQYDAFPPPQLLEASRVPWSRKPSATHRNNRKLHPPAFRYTDLQTKRKTELDASPLCLILDARGIGDSLGTELENPIWLRACLKAASTIVLRQMTKS